MKKKRYRDLVRRRTLPDTIDEQNIIAFCVMHNDVMEAMYNYYRTGQLKLKHITQIYRPIFRSLASFFEKYHKAPNRTIRFIHEGEKAKLNSDEIKITEDLLEIIAKDYQASKEGYSITPEYIVQEMIPRFLRARKLKEISDKLDTNIEKGNIDQAEELIGQYEKVSSEPPKHMEGFNSPHEYGYFCEYIERVRNEGSKIVYTFPGALNYLIGPIKYEWLVSASGTTKSGKSFFLLDMAQDAALNHKRKVAYFNLEMGEEDTYQERIIPWVTGRTTDPTRKGLNYIPIFDCINNQTGQCQAQKAMGKGRKRESLRIGEGKLCSFNEFEQPNKQTIPYIDQVVDSVNNWKVCTICRNLKERFQYSKYKKFRPSIFYKPIKIKKYSSHVGYKKFKALTAFKNENFKIRYFPKYSLTIEEAFDIIRNLMNKYNWKPDMVFFDYLDILKPTSGNAEMTWQDYDHMWKLASAFAQEIKATVITADQTTKAGRTTRLQDHTQTPQASTKDNHVDLKIGINKFEEETQNNICRASVIYHRHRAFSRNLEVIMLQNLTLAKTMLDTEFWLNDKMPPYPVKLPERIYNY